MGSGHCEAHYRNMSALSHTINCLPDLSRWGMLNVLNVSITIAFPQGKIFPYIKSLDLKRAGYQLIPKININQFMIHNATNPPWR